MADRERLQPNGRAPGPNRRERHSRDPDRNGSSRPDALAAHIAETHRRYLERQGSLQRDFLEFRRRAGRRLPDLEGPNSGAVRVGRIDEPAVECEVAAFGRERLEAFTDGDVYRAFGPGFERAACQTSPPKIPFELHCRLEAVDAFEPTDGPRGGGYVRGVGAFEPGDLASERRLREQALLFAAFYLIGCGHTLSRDGWNLELLREFDVDGATFELDGDSTTPLVFELHVLEHRAEPVPRVDALFRASTGEAERFRHRFALGLTPDWPLREHPEWLRDNCSDRAATVDGVCLDENALLAGALGPLRAGLGRRFEPFDGPGRTARLPGPPFQFLSRIRELDAEPGDLSAGDSLVAEYDVPDRCWYFDASDGDAMPLSVLMEVGLQSCGWLAVFGLLPEFDGERFFRNLDGSMRVLEHVTPDCDRLRTEVDLETVSRTGGMALVSYEATIIADDGTAICEMESDFGFFSEESLVRQDGLPTDSDTEQNHRRPVNTSVNLTDRPARLVDGAPRLPAPMLSMLDEITGWWPDAGEQGLGRVRARCEVDPESWYFRAHFFQDPVQPGSLGVEAMLQALQWYMLREDLGADFEDPEFEPVAPDDRLDWSYRGQVLPEHDEVTVDLEVVELRETDDGTVAVADASLWVDDLRIYEVEGLAARVSPRRSERPRVAAVERFDPNDSEWLRDHRPTYTRPAVPMTVVADRIASAASSHTGEPVAELRDVELEDWVVVDRPKSLALEVDTGRNTDWCEVQVYARDAEPGPGAEAPARVARGEVRCSSSRPAPGTPVEPPSDGRFLENPYEKGRLFHGPAFQLLREGEIGDRGATGVADAAASGVPVGTLHPALLDAALHLIPHDRLERWSDRAAPDRVAYPHRIESMQLFGPAPTEGDVRIDVRFCGFESGDQFPIFEVQLGCGDAPWTQFRIVGMTVPEGPFGRAGPEERLRFLRHRRFVPELGLSRFEGDCTRVSAADYQTYAWFDGFLSDLYDVDGDLRDQLRRIAVKDHLAQRLRVHPSRIRILSDGPETATADVPETCEPAREVAVRHGGALEFEVRGGSY